MSAVVLLASAGALALVTACCLLRERRDVLANRLGALRRDPTQRRRRAALAGHTTPFLTSVALLVGGERGDVLRDLRGRRGLRGGAGRLHGRAVRRRRRALRRRALG